MSKRKLNDPNLEITKYQKYEKETIRRGEIKNAVYNPRHISDQARNKLKNKIKKVGLVNAPVWNRRTGNLVSGHQRLGIIDSLERSQDYLITVDVIDVDEKEEKALNVFLNNTAAMGEFDEVCLKDLIEDLGSENIVELGFDNVDLDYIRGTGVFDKKQDRCISPELSKLGEIKDARRKNRESSDKIDDAGFFAVVVFQDREGVERWVTAMGYPPNERYLKGEIIEAATQPRIGEGGR